MSTHPLRIRTKLDLLKVDLARLRKVWDETKHPRGSHGRFASSTTGESGLVFHGSRQAFDPRRSDPLYLTTDPEEAAAFAHGVHLGGHGAHPQVHSLGMLPGKVRNIDEEISQAMDEGDFGPEIIDDIIREEKANHPYGARYLQFQHPSGAGGDDFTAMVSLYPDQDLRHHSSRRLTAR
jgi:hypothetical protein